MAAPARRTVPVYTHEILDRKALWKVEESRSDDLERACGSNKAIQLKRNGVDLWFCLLLSQGCSHLATISASPNTNSITVTVYGLNIDIIEEWTSTHDILTDRSLGETHSVSWYDRTNITGGVTEDGQAVFVSYKASSGAVHCWTVTPASWVSRNPPSDTKTDYSLTQGVLSDDSEHLFYSRRGASFGHNGQAQAVEAYSIRTTQNVRGVTFGFGNGRSQMNTKLLRPLNLTNPIYCAIATAGFTTGFRENRTSPALIVSSDRKLHWNCERFDEMISYGSSETACVSPDGKELFLIHRDDALVSHWDLTSPTLKPLGSIRLPGVQYSVARRWLIHGEEQSIRDAIPKQIHTIRYSPKSKLVTILTASNSWIAVNVLSTLNLQIVYHEKVAHANWAGYVPVHIGMNETAGLSVFGMSPTLTYSSSGQASQIVGVLGVLVPITGVFEKIKHIEDYFDFANERATSMTISLKKDEGVPILRYSWAPSGSDSILGIVHELGQRPTMKAIDTQRQRWFYDLVFADPKSSVKLDSNPELRQLLIPHLFSFTYPWDTNQTVSMFGIVMKNEYHIVVIGSPARPPTSNLDKIPEIIRVLYVGEIKTSVEDKERIGIYQSGPNYILYISEDAGIGHGYSGAPMPTPRCTIITPHFLEEDAWYDTFILKRAESVTLPTGWISTPNPSLTLTTSFVAYFQQRITETQGEEIDYGHRARSCYVIPKHTLWRTYGLRKFRSRGNDFFFGGGKYQDGIGYFYRMIYDDRTYNEDSPLFASTFAATCNMDFRAKKTKHIDAFFRRFHQSNERVLLNGQTISSALPLAFRARPSATLSFMRHIVLFPHRIEDIGSVEVKSRATKIEDYSDWRHSLRRLARDWVSPFWRLFLSFFWTPTEHTSEPNTSIVTLPLPGFSSFNKRLYKIPPGGGRDDDSFWEFVRGTYPGEKDYIPWETGLVALVRRSARGPASPFTRLVDEILLTRDWETQLACLRVVWFEKLLQWKVRKFGRFIYLTRVALPMLLLFLLHLILSILLTKVDNSIGPGLITLACLEAIVSLYIFFTKFRQASRVPRLFFRSIFNYIDTIAGIIGLTTFGMVVSKHHPPRALLAFSTPIIWMALILMARIYSPVGLLLLLLTEMTQRVFPFLLLLAFIILGFGFVPFILLRNLTLSSGDATIPNPFSNFGLSISQMLNFMASDYGALEVFEDFPAVRTLKALYIIVITVLFLNALIAMLNLKIKTADKNAANLYLRQIACLQVEIELGLLSTHERKRRDWFPQWFIYSMTEPEKQNWNNYVEKNPLKWSEENSFDEDGEHNYELTTKIAPVAGTSTATATTSVPQVTVADDDDLYGDDSRPSQSGAPKTEEPRVFFDGKPAKDLTSALLETIENPEQEAEELKNSQAGPVSTVTIEELVLDENACVICGKEGKLCTSCKLVAYCGKEHQKQDWKRHKKDCKGKGKA